MYADLPPDDVAALMQRAPTLGSGTSTLPATSPMRMWSASAGGWLWMFHGDAVLGGNHQGGPRGDLAWAAENWQMAMGSRYWGPGILDLRAMTSLEPWTLPPGGTPQLLQAGETWQGRPLLDKQHPHELLMELAGRYTWLPAPDTQVFGYGALVGEPALGPVAFMHRPSAADNHWAPLAHHLQDSTHISQGVATAGVRSGPLQLEASAFNGREPDEDRVAITLAPLDSWSTRLSWIPGPNVVGQVSYGRLTAPSVVHPGDETRLSASLVGAADTAVGRWSAMAVWGQGVELGPTGAPLLTLQSYGLESQLDMAERLHLYGRYELVDRAGMPPLPVGSHVIQRVGALTLGLSRDLGAIDRWALAVGADATALSLEPFQKPVYGDNPLSVRFYVRLRPPTMGGAGAGPGMMDHG